MSTNNLYLFLKANLPEINAYIQNWHGCTAGSQEIYQQSGNRDMGVA